MRSTVMKRKRRKMYECRENIYHQVLPPPEEKNMFHGSHR